MSIRTALEARRAQLNEREAGFTLIELLVVVIIIGVLAAIAIPVYIGIQNNAKNSQAQSDLTNAKTAWVAYVADKSAAPGTTSSTDMTVLQPYGYTASAYKVGAAPTVVAATSDGTKFCLKATSDSGATSIYYITSATAATTTACTTAQ